VVRYGWDDYQTIPEDSYIMSYNVPLEPVVTGDSALCASIETVYTVPQNGSDYDFVVTGGTVTNETDYSISIIWNNDSLNSVIGSIQVIETVPNNINGGCTSLTRNYNVEIWPLPIAAFGISTDPTLPGGIFVHDILGMVDSSINTSEWYWDFGDGTTSTATNPYHSYYETGTYTIQLVTRSGLECLDTVSIDVDVVEGLIVPNVFTPNNDGWNDVFNIRTSAVGPYKLEIYNRWGNVIFENTSPLISWDGTTAAGVPASAGTYFFVISKAEMLSGNAINNELDNFNYKETGWLQLLR
jgi:gliding motility-associated-like protein